MWLACKGTGTAAFRLLLLVVAFIKPIASLDSVEAPCDAHIDDEYSSDDIPSVSLLQTQLVVDEVSLKPGMSLRDLLRDTADAGRGREPPQGAGEEGSHPLGKVFSRAMIVSGLTVEQRQQAYECALLRLQDIEGVPKGCRHVESAAMFAAITDPPAADLSQQAERQAWLDASEVSIQSGQAAQPAVKRCARQRLESEVQLPQACMELSPAAMFASLRLLSGSGSASQRTQILAGEESEAEAGPLPAVAVHAGWNPEMNRMRKTTGEDKDKDRRYLPFENETAMANLSNITNATVITGKDIARDTEHALAKVPGFKVWGSLILAVGGMLVGRWLVSKTEARDRPDGRCVGEFVGTLILAFVATCCALIGTTLVAAFAIALAVVVVVYSMGSVGMPCGHINPAVTLSFGLTRKLAWRVVYEFWIAQFSGAFVGCCAAQALLGEKKHRIYPEADSVSVVYLGTFSYEVLYTSLLCFVVMNCSLASRNHPNQFSGLAIGMAVLAGLIHGSHKYGAYLNPAVGIGYDISTLDDGFGESTLWALADLLGAFVGALLFGVMRPEDFPQERQERDRLEPGSFRFTETYTRPLWIQCSAEFYGTFVLMVTLGAFSVPEVGSAAAVAVAGCLTALVYSLGELSGGHFNPAVTLACWLTGRDKLALDQGICYWVSQFLGGALGGILSVCARLNDDYWPLRLLAPGQTHTLWGVGVTEAVYTAMLAYVVLCTATAQPRSRGYFLSTLVQVRGNYHFALAIGGTVVAGLSSGSVSGGLMNPALAVGCLFGSVVEDEHMGKVFGRTFAYMGFEFLGAVAAQIIFYYTHVHEYWYTLSLPLLDRTNSWRWTFAVYFSEFIGTFFLAFSVALCTIAIPSGWSALGVGATLMVLVYAIGPVSGAHLNPAVTLCLYLCRKFTSLRMMFMYWLMQIGGGILGALWGAELVHEDVIGSITAAKEPYEWHHAALLEIIFTSALCLAVANCACADRDNRIEEPNSYFGLGIAAALGAAAAASGGVCHATFNPAVALGMEVGGLRKGARFGWSFIWAASQLIGGVFGAIFFYIVRPEDELTMPYRDTLDIKQTEFEALRTADALPAEDKRLLEEIEAEIKRIHAELEGLHRDPPVSFLRKLQAGAAAEFIGTFMLCFVVGLCLLSGQGGLITAVAASAMLCSMVYSLGSVSGAHLNPAVTLAIVASGREKCGEVRATTYWMCQTIAGLLAGLLAWHYNDVTPVGLAIPRSDTVLTVGFSELCFTFLLCYAVLATATVDPWPTGRSCFYFGLCIGICVAIGGFSIGSISGAELNPAVSLAIWIIGECGGSNLEEGTSFSLFVLNSLWELAGGLLAACVFYATHITHYGFFKF